MYYGHLVCSQNLLLILFSQALRRSTGKFTAAKKRCYLISQLITARLKS